LSKQLNESKDFKQRILLDHNTIPLGGSNASAIEANVPFLWLPHIPVVNDARFPTDLSPMKIFAELHLENVSTRQFLLDKGIMEVHGSNSSTWSFFAFLIVMDIVRRDNRDEYWSEGIFKDQFRSS
jgi:hypothetical protein